MSTESERPQKMAATVAGVLRRRILSGDLAVGASITEAGLAEEFQISRPTLREALRILEMEQLLSVQRGSHRGSVVRLPDASVTVRSITSLLHLRGATMLDIYDARLAFEPPAVRMAAQRCTADEVAGLRNLLDEGIQEMRAQKLLYPTVGWRFHTALVAASGNATLALMAQSFERISAEHSVAVTTAWTEQCGLLVTRAEQAHRKVIDLIESGDGERAEVFWRAHMLVVRGLLFGAGRGGGLVELLD